MNTLPQIPAGKRVYAVGDVHGCLDLLAELIGKIRRDNENRAKADVTLILLGDLIDRGPDSAAVIDLCRDLSRRHNQFVVLKGNHEAIMVDAVRGGFSALAFWLQHGGDTTLENYGISTNPAEHGLSREFVANVISRVPDPVLKWLDRLPIVAQHGNCVFVHAGIRPGVTLSDQTEGDILWIRDDFLNSDLDDPYVVIHGHTINEAAPRLERGRVSIDTGAYRTGRLTAIGLEGDDYWILSTDPESTVMDEGTNPLSVQDNIKSLLQPERSRGKTTRRVGIAATVTLAYLLLFSLSPDWKTASFRQGQMTRPARQISPATLPVVANDVIAKRLAQQNLTTVTPEIPPPVTVEEGVRTASQTIRIFSHSDPALTDKDRPRKSGQQTSLATVVAEDRRPPSQKPGQDNVPRTNTTAAINKPKSPPVVVVASVPREESPRVPAPDISGTGDRPRMPAGDPVTAGRSTRGATARADAARERANALDAIRLLRRQ